jgi:hypothetical protein
VSSEETDITRTRVCESFGTCEDVKRTGGGW